MCLSKSTCASRFHWRIGMVLRRLRNRGFVSGTGIGGVKLGEAVWSKSKILGAFFRAEGIIQGRGEYGEVEEDVRHVVFILAILVRREEAWRPGPPGQGESEGGPGQGRAGGQWTARSVGHYVSLSLDLGGVTQSFMTADILQLNYQISVKSSG